MNFLLWAPLERNYKVLAFYFGNNAQTKCSSKWKLSGEQPLPLMPMHIKLSYQNDIWYSCITCFTYLSILSIFLNVLTTDPAITNLNLCCLLSISLSVIIFLFMCWEETNGLVMLVIGKTSCMGTRWTCFLLAEPWMPYHICFVQVKNCTDGNMEISVLDTSKLQSDIILLC